MKPRLFLALLLPFLACGLQWLLWDPWVKPYVWFLFFPVAFFAAWLGGVVGGVGATLISAGLVWFVFIPPQFSFTMESPSADFSILVFIAMGGLFTWLFERLRRARLAADSRFEATFEQAAVGIALVAPGGHWLRVNRKLCAIVGYTHDELMAKTFQDITHPDDLDADLEFVRRMFARELDTYSMEKRYFHKDGHIVWINLTVALVWKPDGTPDYFISVVEDISARKAAEADARANEARLSEAKRLAGLGHWHWDLATGVHTWSEEIYRMYGRAPELPPAGYPEVQQYFTPASWAVLTAAVEQGMAEARPYECDAEVVRPDGSHAWVTTRGQAVRDAKGKVVALHGTVQDISARKEAEAALQESERRYREVVENANSAILHWSSDGAITFCNEYAQRLFGWQADEIIGRHVSILVPDQSTDGLDLSNLIKDIAANPDRYLSNVNENVCRDGRRLWMNWTNRALRDDQGRVTGLLAVGNDISALKQAEEELKSRYQELERFDRAAVGREMEMIRLKRQVNELARELGRAEPFDLSFLDAPMP